MNIITIRKKLQEKLIPEHLRAAGIVPVLAYSEDDYTFLMDDKSIGFGFYCHPLCGADEKIQERVNGFMNQEYPAKTTMQFILCYYFDHFCFTCNARVFIGHKCF